ncbi:MAG: hypothetical protein ABIQ44_12650 [Chloroflexia bacterium]
MNSSNTEAIELSDEQITERVVKNLDGFDAYNWLAFVNKAVGIDDLAGIAACDWSSEETRTKALDCGCIGITLAASFRVGFGTSYHAIADAFKGKYGDGFWQKGFSYALSSPEREEFYGRVRETLPVVLATLRDAANVGRS